MPCFQNFKVRKSLEIDRSDAGDGFGESEGKGFSEARVEGGCAFFGLVLEWSTEKEVWMLEDKRCRNPDCRQEMVSPEGIPPRARSHWSCKNPECGWHADRVVKPENRPKKVGVLWKRIDLAEDRKVEKIEPIEPTEDGPWWVFSSPIGPC